MKKRVGCKLFGIGFIVSLWFLIACQPTLLAPTSQPITTITSPSVSVVHVLTIRPTSPLVPTKTPNPTATVTFTPQPMPTLTSLPTPTPTLLPTLLPEEVVATVSWLRDTNNGCQLPCWWGIMPGQTGWLTAKQFLLPISSRITEPLILPTTSLWNVEVDLIDEGSQIYSIYNDLIIQIEGYIYPSTWLNPPNVLATYGPPDEVWLLAGKGAYEDGSFPFFVTFFYPRRGFLLEYVSYKAWREGDIENGMVHGCLPGEMQYLVVWSPQEEQLSYFERLAETVHYHTSQAVLYAHTLEEATGLTVERWFAERNSSEKPFCLETPASMWPGY